MNLTDRKLSLAACSVFVGNLMLFSYPCPARADGPRAKLSPIPSADTGATSRRTTTSDAEELHWAAPGLHALALFGVMRSTEAYLWPDPFSFHQVDEWPQRYERAFTMPPLFDSSQPFMRWDGDPWEINVLGHGLLGSELYLRPRRCGLGVAGSLAYAALTTAIWEYAFEANGVRPSGVDLWYTPLSGALLGEGRYLLWRLAEDIDSPALRQLVRTLLDPIGEFSTGVLCTAC